MSDKTKTARSFVTLIVLPLLALFLQGCSSNSQVSFATPEEASDALVSALRADDSARLTQILGKQGMELIQSGDEVADRQAIERFLAAYDKRHSLVSDDQASRTLQVGDNDWPVPIPIVSDKGKWLFDTESGREEILNRRVGQNELSALQVCLAIVDAQREYAMSDMDRDGVPEYAPKFLSDEGKRDGLYWQVPPGERPSPLGPMLAAAAAEGYTAAKVLPGEPTAYHGYKYRVLTSQGSSARGGAYDYLINGKMIGGFGVVAFPAEYGNSGIMTFITNHEGDVYQKDLGDDTEKLGQAMTKFNPGEGWRKIDPPPPEAP